MATSEFDMPGSKVEESLRDLSISDKKSLHKLRLEERMERTRVRRINRLSNSPLAHIIPCEVCSELGHSYYKCPLVISAQEGDKVSDGWAVVCFCCLKEKAHPGDKTVARHAMRRYCGRCCGSHLAEDCPKPSTYEIVLYLP